LYDHPKLGSFKGLRDEKLDVVKFYGIPFANEPIRFAMAELKTNYEDDIIATDKNS
jgi:hypothetical protein